MYLTAKNAGWHNRKMFYCIFCKEWVFVFFLEYEVSDTWAHLIFSFSFPVIYTHFLFVLEFDRHELQIYEEVARMPPFQRKTLILIGAQGVGRRSLKNRLIMLNPLLFGTTVPCRFNNYSWSACLS